MNEDIYDKLSVHEKRINDLESRLAKLEISPIENIENQNKELTIRQFIDQKNPKGDNQKTLAIGYFLEVFDGLESFDVNDLEDGYISARGKVPANIASTVKRNIDKKLIMLAKAKKNGPKAYLVSNSRIIMVEADFKSSK